MTPMQSASVPLRILAVGNLYPPHHMGGYEIVWQGAMRRAREFGHSVRVLTSNQRAAGVVSENDPDVHRELRWYWRDHGWPRYGPLERLHLERDNAAILEWHLADLSPDVVSFWSMAGMSLSLVERVARRLPSVLVVHDDWLVFGPKVDAWMRLWSGRRRPLGAVAAPIAGIPTAFSQRRRELVLANSEYVLRRAREERYSLPDAAVISPGIEQRFLNTSPARGWGWRLLCVGRIDRRKGIDVAIAALAKMPEEATLTIAGAGDHSYEEELRTQVSRLGLDRRVKFSGHVRRDELPQLYASADAVVFPVRWDEPFGLVPLEAMGIGRPVVATARGGAAEYLREGENALIVPKDDAAAIAGAVGRLAADAALRERLRAGGRKTAAANTAAAFEERIVQAHELAARRLRT